MNSHVLRFVAVMDTEYSVDKARRFTVSRNSKRVFICWRYDLKNNRGLIFFWFFALLGIFLPLGRYHCCVRATPAQLRSPWRKVPRAWQSEDPGTRDLQVWINKVLHEQSYGSPKLSFIAWNHKKILIFFRLFLLKNFGEFWKDFHIGATLVFNDVPFIIVGADDYAISYMESHADEYEFK